jgi:RNA polymerase sigma-70 factor (ECF subfamily)
MEIDTKNILCDIATGDNEAFKALFNMFFPKVKVFLVKFLKDDKAAEDIAQDIFVKIWSLRYALPEIKSFNTYLYRMTRNAALNYLRDQKYAVNISEIPILDDSDIEQEYYRKEKELLIRLAVEQMPPQRRKIFTMSRYQAMSNDEIAKALNLSKHTVENHLSISLKELRDLMVAFALFFLI